MPRAHLSKRLPDEAAIRLFAEHHITHVRRRKNGEILAVKHSTFGWISPQQYYGLQKVHELIPLVREFIRGGYQLKWALYTATIDLGVGLGTIPAGAIVPGWALLHAYGDLDAQRRAGEMGLEPAFQVQVQQYLGQNALTWFLLLLLPYGDFLIMAHMLYTVTHVGEVEHNILDFINLLPQVLGIVPFPQRPVPTGPGYSQDNPPPPSPPTHGRGGTPV